MKRIKILITGLMICFLSQGQIVARQSAEGYPPESIKVHLSETSLFPGAVLGFKIYCTNPFFPEAKLSTLAFIELLNDQNVPILRKRILLENGSGAGEFLLPDHLGSGIYTLLTYTNWLKNFGESSFHSQSLVIINPDQGLPELTDSSKCLGMYMPVRKVNDPTPSGLLVLPDKKQYSTREKVSITLALPQEAGAAPGGHFSVSVCQTEPILQEASFEMERQNPELEPGEIVFLPDFGGIRLSGKLEDAMGHAMPGEKIVSSRPGPGTHIESTISDNAGNFHFLLPAQSGERELVFTLPGSGAVIKLEEPYWNGYRDPPEQFGLCLKDNAVTFLEDKFNHFQIQEKFNLLNFSESRQQAKNIPDSSSFHNSYSKQLRMADYILLDSLPEFFYELVPNIRFTHNKEGTYIRVSDPENGIPYEEKPGVFVDGVLYSDHKEIAQIPLHKIDRIAILPEIYYYGNFSFGGIIDLHTTESDFNSVQLLPEMTRMVVPLASRSEMEFDAPDYSLYETLNRIPDYRHLIAWEPDVAIGPSGEATVLFYTGDLTGDYTVKVFGLSAEGKFIQSETNILVE